MIILEGVDNSGKSSLAAILEKELQIPVVHSTRPPEDPKAAYWAAMEQLGAQLIIADRVTVISELIYGPALRGGSVLGKYHAPALYELMNRDYLIINCRPPTDVILDNKGREQMEGVVENHLKLIQGYDRVMVDLKRFGGCKVLDYDWTKSITRRQVIDACRKFYDKQRERILSTKFVTGVYNND